MDARERLGVRRRRQDVRHRAYRRRRRARPPPRPPPPPHPRRLALPTRPPAKARRARPLPNKDTSSYFTTLSIRPLRFTYVPRFVENESRMPWAATFCVEAVSCCGSSVLFT